MSARAQAFDKALREVAVPALSAHGFTFDGSRSFRRLSSDGRISQIINFQLGQRWLAGKFTVNLGVFVEGDLAGVTPSSAKEIDCRSERRRRIGAVVPLQFPRLANLPFVGFLFGVPDKWWAFSEDRSRTSAAVASALSAVQQHGLGWLAASGP